MNRKIKPVSEVPRRENGVFYWNGIAVRSANELLEAVFTKGEGSITWKIEGQPCTKLKFSHLLPRPGRQLQMDYATTILGKVFITFDLIGPMPIEELFPDRKELYAKHGSHGGYMVTDSEPVAS